MIFYCVERGELSTPLYTQRLWRDGDFRDGPGGGLRGVNGSDR